MANPENLQSFINQEKTDIKGIDQTDVKALNSLLFIKENNNTLSLKNEVKETFQQEENLRAMTNGINKFLASPEGIQILQNPSLHKDTLEAYKNILGFLKTNTIENSPINQSISTLEWKISNALNNTNNISNKPKESYETINKVSKEVLSKLFQGMTSSEIKVFADEKISTGAINMFIEQYNNNSTEKLSYTNLLEQLYNLPAEQKDILATYLAQIIISSKSNKEGRTQAQTNANINNYRKSIFPKLFKNDQIAPLLSDQKRAMVGDKSGTDWLIPGVNSEAGFGLGGYEYNERTPETTTTTVDWVAGQNNLDLSLLAAGVDMKGAEIILDIGGIKISGTTLGDKQVNGSKANMINRKIPEKLPNGISFQNGSLKLDAMKLGKKPQIKVTMNSRDKDEVFLTVGTNGMVDAIAGDNNLGDQELFASGGRNMSESGKKSFDKTIGSIHNIVKDRLPNGYKLKIDIGAATSASKVDETLHEKLKGDINTLKKTLATTITSKLGKEAGISYYQNLKTQIEAQLKHETFIDEGNKVLAQCRAYSTLNEMITNMSFSDLNKISLNITPITGNSKRSSQFEMTGIQKIS